MSNLEIFMYINIYLNEIHSFHINLNYDEKQNSLAIHSFRKYIFCEILTFPLKTYIKLCKHLSSVQELTTSLQLV